MNPGKFTFNSFLTGHNIRISPEVKHSCLEGLKIMRKSRDQMHDDRHVLGILKNLGKFMDESREINWSKINYELLLLSICWHDVWKSGRVLNSGHKALYHQFYEGLGSMRVFGKLTKYHSLDKKLVRKVKYSIRKHSMFQFLPTRNTETKILKDLDRLEEWSIPRLRWALGAISDWHTMSPRLVNVGKFYFEHWMLPRHTKKNYFQWTTGRINFKKPAYSREVRRLLHEFARKNFNLLPRPSLSIERQTIYPESEE